MNARQPKPTGVVNLPLAIRDLNTRLSETRHLLPWELQHILFSLGYVDDLVDEKVIAFAVEVARGDWSEWMAA